LFLLGIEVRRAWHRLPSRDRVTACANHLLLSVKLPGRVFIFGEAALMRKFRAIPSREIYRR
jgi:hypothetical protein